MCVMTLLRTALPKGGISRVGKYEPTTLSMCKIKLHCIIKGSLNGCIQHEKWFKHGGVVAWGKARRIVPGSRTITKTRYIDPVNNLNFSAINSSLKILAYPNTNFDGCPGDDDHQNWCRCLRGRSAWQEELRFKHKIPNSVTDMSLSICWFPDPVFQKRGPLT